MTDTRDTLATSLADRYTLERELGRGGMATVYLVRDRKHDRQVALKVLHPELAATLGTERFLREIRVTARLDHPHILPVLDSGTAAGLLWYTMPYVRGETLRDRLRREVQLPVETALDLTRQVASALDHAHREGVVHRDLKPENILLADGQARVADFGVAKALAGAGDHQLTETGLAVGTPAYMSPEQASGGVVDARSDIYALGCVLYEMLAGEPPFTGPTPQAITLKRLTDPVPSVRRVRDVVPEAIERTLVGALAKMPADRFASAGEFARSLTSPLVASPPLGLRVRATQAPLRTIVLGLVIFLGLAVGLFWRSGIGGKTRDYSGSKLLAVLPFKNLGASADQYFADGLTEEITSRLGAVAGIGVISRTSAERYRNTEKSLKEIGRELGATYVLEGSVRWQKQANGSSRIRVTPQLVRVTDDSHLWGERYDAELADVFSVQTHIAEQVTRALDVALAPKEKQALASRPTGNLSAYDAYLRGNAANPPDLTVGAERIVSGWRRAIEHYREAIRLDSTFAVAYARLGSAHTGLSSFGVEPEQHARAAWAAISRALELAPELSEAHATAGIYHFFVDHDTTRTMLEWERALAGRPNDADLLALVGDFEWYIRGPQGRSIQFAERAVVLDPASNSKALILARLYRDAGRYNDAERLYNRVISRDSSSNGPYVMKAYLYLLRDGDTARAQATIRQAATKVDSMALITAAATTAGIGTWGTLAMLDEPFERALLTLTPSAFGDDTAFYGIVKGYSYRARGLAGAFRAYFDSAEVVAQRRLKAYPADPNPLQVLVWTKAVNGHADEAYETMDLIVKKSQVAYFPEKNAWLARLALFAGDTNRALTELEKKDWGSELTIPWLCVDHFWDSLRSHPRFRRVVGERCGEIT